MQPIQYELTTAIKYANGSGAEIECNHVELREPTGKDSATCCAIEALVQSAVLKMADDLGDDVVEEAREQAMAQQSTEDPEEHKDGKAILAIMNGGGVDMGKLVLLFRELFKSVAWMGGEKRITSARLDSMSHKDLRGMIGVYAANFILS